MRLSARTMAKNLGNFMLFYGGLCLIMFALQRELLFVNSGDYLPPAEVGLAQANELRLTTADGLSLVAWHVPAPTGQRTLVYFHGNAKGLTNRARIFSQFVQAGYGLLAVEYRGYPGNEGSPSEQGLYNDARAAMEYLTQQQGLQSEQIVLMGRSLGTGVALKMASEYETHAVFLISPYDSIAHVAQGKYWYLPVHLLIRDPFDALALAPQIDEPVYIFHGTQDHIIPMEHSQLLYDALPNDKHYIALERQGHNRIDFAPIIQTLQRTHP